MLMFVCLYFFTVEFTFSTFFKVFIQFEVSAHLPSFGLNLTGALKMIKFNFTNKTFYFGRY